MILQVFSVYDKKIQAYLQPFFCRTQGEAIRSFTEAVNDPGKQFGKYSSDYALYRFGEYDDASGLFACSDPSIVISANEVVADLAPPRGKPLRYDSNQEA